MNVLRVNLGNKRITKESLPEKYEMLGGRGLTSMMINGQVPPDCDPLGPVVRNALGQYRTPLNRG
ncbi:MAG: hypothetical protein D3926_19995 [Desulfobacteraceae bacterium]|nr:MAG: hypothetical protein D3926_19995 [Desulfobacteraceae bacterium]